MKSFIVINFNSIFGSKLSMLNIKEHLIEKEFVFQNPINSFCYCIFVAVIFFGHADLKASFIKLFNVQVTAILDSPIRMVYYVGAWLGLNQGPLEGPCTARQFQRVADIVSENSP